MKILQVTNFFKPSWDYGGPARSVYEMSKKLVEHGHEVTVYTTDGFKSRLNVVTNKPVFVDDIRTYYFRNLSNYLTKSMNVPIPYYSPLTMRDEIKNFDIIHINEYRTILAIVAHYYAKKYRIPYVLQPRGSVPIIKKSKQKTLFDALFGHAIIQDASKIIASSKIESDQYWDVFPELNDERIVHIPNGIDVDLYQNLPQKGIFKKKYLIKEEENIVLFLSRIHERKGADTLIAAFSELKGMFENIKLVVAGPDENYLDNLKRIVKSLNINDDVIFTGPLYERDKLEAYVDANIFVLPSKDHYESFGNVVLEAMACGTPVIVTNNCGVSEWIIDDNVGYVYVVEYGKDQLREAMFNVLSDDKQKTQFNGESYILVGEKFGWDNILKNIEDLYRGCL